jgi:hypothetical protein
MIGMITASARHNRPCRQRNGTKPICFNDFSRARACAYAQGGVRSSAIALQRRFQRTAPQCTAPTPLSYRLRSDLSKQATNQNAAGFDGTGADGVCGPFCAIASDVPPVSSAATITKLFTLLIVVLQNCFGPLTREHPLFLGKVLASDRTTASYVHLFVAKSARGVESRCVHLIISK